MKCTQRKYTIYSGLCVERWIHRKYVYNSNKVIPLGIKVIEHGKMNILDGI